MRGFGLIAIIVTGLALPAVASARVRLISVTSPVRAGSNASLIVAVVPAERCSIAVYYKGRRAKAKGLYPKRATRGRISWTWKVTTATPRGKWPIMVLCASPAGSLRTSFVVR
jgi:hypothetical protein